MNFFRKPTNRYDDNGYVDVVEEGGETTVIADEEAEVTAGEPSRAPKAQKSSGSGLYSGVNLGGSSIEMKVVRPERFDSVSAIADHLLSGRTVVLNLEATTKDVARRLIDFLSGVAYSIDGQIKRIANCTYIITPNNVDVSDTAGTADAAERADDEIETEE